MSSAKLKPLVVILGPTASGKSSLAIKLAKQFNGAIVSADSRQIYKGMDIGTGKVSKKEMNNIPHHLLDIILPNKDFSLAQYKKKALKAISDIHKKKKLPFLVGGTGLYIKSIVENLDIPQVKPNKAIRVKIEKDIKEKGLDKVYQQLIKLDPRVSLFIDKKNPRRVLRALEVCLVTGQPFSKSRKKGKPLFNILQIGLKVDSQELNKKIDQRVDQMIKDGLVRENEKLLKKYSVELSALTGIGYRETVKYLNKEISLDKAKELIKTHTRQYAKRQLTWFKKDPSIKWVLNEKQAQRLINDYLLQYPLQHNLTDEEL